MSESTSSRAYTQRLTSLQTIWWKRLIPVQLPYRLHLRSLRPGYMLDIGCGIGRNLCHVDGNGVGVDHNVASVALANEKGFTAFTADEFHRSDLGKGQRFDSLLLSHVLEHMKFEDGQRIVQEYLPRLKKGGQIILICPQEAGYKTDKTHVEYMDQAKLLKMLSACGLKSLKAYSYPFPSFIGKFFPYNENVVIGLKS